MDVLCLPKHQGGLGLKSLAKWNVALMTTHIWSILTNKNSLWVRWIHAYRLEDRNFWDVPLKQDASWGWRKLLRMREEIRKFVVYKIGNGKGTSVWFDKWSNHESLDKTITKRMIHTAGYDLNTTVYAMVVNGEWQWPNTWRDEIDNINTIPCPILNPDRDDKLCWMTKTGELGEFSVNQVWKDIRPEGNEVPWTRVVWFSQCIPRHAFILWLVLGQKLKTQDKMRTWDSNPDAICMFCNAQKDTHNHLFFECEYPTQVWRRLRMLANMHTVPGRWTEVVTYLQPRSRGNTIWSVIGRLVFSAAIYFIWQERNNRVFKKGTRSIEKLHQDIFEVVRLKVLSLTLKHSPNVEKALRIWKISNPK